jgi:flagellar hook-associated protein 2
MPGATISVSRANPGAQVTVAVASDPAAVATKMKALVAAANDALSSIKVYSDSDGGKAATLKGDSSLSRLTSQVLSAVSYGVGTIGSPGQAGLELTRDGTIAFDEEKFLAALAADPGLVQELFVGSPAGPGPDGLLSTTGDNTAAVPGAVQRLLDMTKTATDTATGTLVTLAKSRDGQAKDIQDNIDAWDLRLELRRATLTSQFTAMEMALSTMQNQSNWLAGQLSSLPSTQSS